MIKPVVQSETSQCPAKVGISAIPENDRMRLGRNWLEKLGTIWLFPVLFFSLLGSLSGRVRVRVYFGSWQVEGGNDIYDMILREESF